GLLVACETDAGLAAARKELAIARDNGIAGEALDADAARAREPAIAGTIRGGAFYPDEATAEPLAVVQTMARLAAAAGADIRPGAEVYDFDVAGGRVAAVRTTRGTLAADTIVLATGSWSRSLGRRLGLRLPVLGGKGYAVVVPRFEPAPARPGVLLEPQIAGTPRPGAGPGASAGP